MVSPLLLLEIPEKTETTTLRSLGYPTVPHFRSKPRGVFFTTDTVSSLSVRYLPEGSPDYWRRLLSECVTGTTDIDTTSTGTTDIDITSDDGLSPFRGVLASLVLRD